MLGAQPRWLSAAFVIEEGFAIAELRDIVADMAEAARLAGVAIVAGDTKVVDRGAADGLYITTAGVGVLPEGRSLGPELVQPGDVVLVSGTIADHGMAVMLARGDLALEADIRSDTAPLGDLVEALLAGGARRPAGCATPPAAGSARCATSWPRPPTWPSCSTKPCCPIDPAVNAACDLLGIDPLYVANEGKLVAVVAARRGRRGPGRAPGAPDRRRRGRGGGDQGRSRGHRRAAHDLRRHAHRRHARGRPAAAHLLTPVPDVAAVRHRIRVTGTVQGVGLPTVRVPPGPVGSACTVGCRTTAPACCSRSRATEPAVRELARLLVDDPPPLARVASVEAQAIPVAGGAGLLDRRQCLVGGGHGAGQRRHRHLRGVPGRGRRPGRSPLPLPVHQLHGLRSPLHDRPLRALRPARHDDGRLHDVPGVPGRVRRPLRPPVPRPAQRVPRVRPAAVVVPPRDGDGATARGDAALAAAVDGAPRRRDRRRSRGSVASTSPSTPPTRRPWQSSAAARRATTSRSR